MSACNSNAASMRATLAARPAKLRSAFNNNSASKCKTPRQAMLGGAFLVGINLGIDADVGSAQAFGLLTHFKFDLLAFFERAITIGFNRS